MPRTHVVIRKSSLTPPSTVVQLTGLAATAGLGVLTTVASARRVPTGVTSTALAGAISVVSPTGDEWATLAAGSVMATRFDTEGEVLDYRLLDTKSSNITWDQARKWFDQLPGGGSLRDAINDADTENSGNWFRHLDDAFGLFTGSGGQVGGVNNSTDQGYDPGVVFEVAFAVFIPRELRDTIFPGGGGWKFGMVAHDGKSNNSFEIVWQNSIQRGYPQGYHRNPPFTQPWQTNVDFNCPAAFPDSNFQGQIDRGVNALTTAAVVNPDTGAAWSNCEKAFGRAGTHSYENSGRPDTIPGSRVWKFWERLNTPSTPVGPRLFPPDDWGVFKLRVDLNSYSAATNRIRWYFGTRNDTSWVLLQDDQNKLLPTEVSDYGQGFNKRINAFWQTFFHTGRTGGGGVNTFGNVGWLVSRRDGGVIPYPQTWPDNTPLRQAAATVAQNQWGTLVSTSLTQSLLTRGDVADSIVSFAPRGCRLANQKRCYFYGGTHGNLGLERMIRYIDATNTWEPEEDDSPEDPNNTGGTLNVHHGYYRFAVRPSDGRFFLKGMGDGPVYNRPYNSGGGTVWPTLPAHPGSLFDPFNVASCIEWHPGLHSRAGGLVFCGRGFCYTWSPITNTWTTRLNVAATFPPNAHSWSCWNPPDDAVYFGGDGNPEMWKLVADGTVTRVADVPFDVGVPFQDNPSGTVHASTRGGRMWAMSSAGSIVDYNAIANTWGSQIATRPFTPSNGCYFGIPIWDHRVTMFVWMSGSTVNPSTTMYLFGH